LKANKIKDKAIDSIQKYWKKLISERFLITQFLASILGIIIGVITYDMYNLAVVYDYMGAFDLLMISLGALLVGFMNFHSFMNSVLDKKYAENSIKREFTQNISRGIITSIGVLIMGIILIFSVLINGYYECFKILTSSLNSLFPSYAEIELIELSLFQWFLFIVLIIMALTHLYISLNFSYFHYNLELENERHLKNVRDMYFESDSWDFTGHEWYIDALKDLIETRLKINLPNSLVNPMILEALCRMNELGKEQEELWRTYLTKKRTKNKGNEMKLNKKKDLKYFEFKLQFVDGDKEFGLTITPEKKKEQIKKDKGFEQ